MGVSKQNQEYLATGMNLMIQRKLKGKMYSKIPLWENPKICLNFTT